MTDEKPRLERLAIAVPDLDTWVSRWETILGPEFDLFTVNLGGDDVRVGIHPAGIELLEVPGGEPRLRSFHLRVRDIDAAAVAFEELGWPVTPMGEIRGRRQSVVAADGLRVVLVEVVEGADA